MTPEKARNNMFCPLTNIADKRTNAPSSHRSDQCKADGCMMWRWFDSQKIEGYCGLAGRDGIFREISTE